MVSDDGLCNMEDWQAAMDFTLHKVRAIAIP